VFNKKTKKIIADCVSKKDANKTLRNLKERVMPYKIRKVHGKDCFRVINQNTRKVFAKCTTKENAVKQKRLLRALEFNPQFREILKLNRM
jgi:hypothetical protein